MILELHFQDETHRCSDVPTNLSELRYFLMGTFKTDLPLDFKLSYTLSGQADSHTLDSEEEYQKLLAQNSSEPVQITIIGAPKANEPEERKNSDPVPVPKGNADEPNRYPYFSYMSPQDEHIRKIVRETLQDQLPYVISQVRDALVKEFNLRAPQPRVERVQPPVEVVRVERQEVEENKNLAPKLDVFDKEENEEVNMGEAKSDPSGQRAGKTGIFDQVKKFGASIKDQVSELPNKTKEAFDTLSQRVSGDPYMETQYGRYPESVVKKALLMNEIFPEEERKVLLEFVKRYSRVVTLEQLANLYLMKDEVQDVEPAAEDKRPAVQDDRIIDN